MTSERFYYEGMSEGEKGCEDVREGEWLFDAPGLSDEHHGVDVCLLLFFFPIQLRQIYLLGDQRHLPLIRKGNSIDKEVERMC